MDTKIKMKIYFDNVNFNSNTGPNSFSGRLANEFKNLGHDIVSYEDNYDVHLAFIHFTKQPKKNAVLRLDGIWFRPDNFEQNNLYIKKSYDFANKVVILSEFDKTMIEKYFGKRDNINVIHNGCPIKKADKIESFAGRMNFVCSANWHGQKRLDDNIRLFQKIRKEQHPNAVLHVLGSDAKTIENIENVVFHGQVSHENCLKVFASCDYMIHLAWLDHCPNAVCEALSQGCPVICTESGGTKEIVKDNGIIIKELRDYNFELLDYDKPYPLDFSGFKLPEKRIEVENSYIDIKKVAQKYLEIF